MPRELKLYFVAVIGFLALYTLGKMRAGIDIHTFRAVGSYALGFAIFLLGVEKLGVSRAGKFLGDRSYSFYLVHMPVIALCYALTLGADGRPAIPQAVFALLAFSLALAASSAMYRFVEQPSNRFGHRLRKRANGSIEHPVAPAHDRN